jgi:hypothetical protein
MGQVRPEASQNRRTITNARERISIRPRRKKNRRINIGGGRKITGNALQPQREPRTS